MSVDEFTKTCRVLHYYYLKPILRNYVTQTNHSQRHNSQKQRALEIFHRVHFFIIYKSHQRHRLSFLRGKERRTPNFPRKIDQPRMLN